MRSLGGWRRGSTGFEAETVINGDDSPVHICHADETPELAQFLLDTFPVEMGDWLDRKIAERTYGGVGFDAQAARHLNSAANVVSGLVLDGCGEDGHALANRLWRVVGFLRQRAAQQEAQDGG